MRSLASLVLLTALASGCVVSRTDVASSSHPVAGWSGTARTTSPGSAAGSVASATVRATVPAGSAVPTRPPADPVDNGAICFVAAPRVPASTQAGDPAGLAWIPSICEGREDGAITLSVQKSLVRLGYLAGGEDGLYGPRTRAAVERFKRDRSIYGDGLTAETLDALGVAWQRPPAVSGGMAH